MSEEIKKEFNINPVCGLHVPAGWLELVTDTLRRLSEIKGWDPSNVAQIKEKFGGLRIYLDNHLDPEVNLIITAAEKCSLSICQRCGSDEAVTGRTRGWVATLCSSCREGSKNEGF